MQQREDNEAESEKKESVEKEEQQNRGYVFYHNDVQSFTAELGTALGNFVDNSIRSQYPSDHNAG